METHRPSLYAQARQRSDPDEFDLQRTLGKISSCRCAAEASWQRFRDATANAGCPSRSAPPRRPYRARWSAACVIAAAIYGFDSDTGAGPPFRPSGPVHVKNVQDASEPISIGPGVAAPLSRISEELAERMRKELTARGVQVSPDSPVELRIFLDRYMAIPSGFTTRVSSRILVSGGNRLEKQFDVVNHSAEGRIGRWAGISRPQRSRS